MYDQKKTVAITGASGFIGRHLTQLFIRKGNYNLRILSNNGIRKEWNRKHITVIEGDIEDSTSLKEFLLPGCTVINLVYMMDKSREENVRAIDKFTQTCVNLRVEKLIHCSTAVVVGRSDARLIDENTRCNTTNTYERTKLDIEQLLLERYSNLLNVVILRPTAVFGPGGGNLLPWARGLKNGIRIANYLRSCILNNCRMNLVYIDNVVSAIAFLVDNGHLSKQSFIISDGEAPDNNYRDIEKCLLRKFGGKDYFLPIIPFPFFILRLFIAVTKRPNINPNSVYDCSKLIRSGFKKPVPFNVGLERFAEWCITEFSDSV